MGIISVEQVDHLYWLGRYTERVYTTLKLYAKCFDRMIESGDEVCKDYCAALDIPYIYGSREEFLKRYPFDEQVVDSIISNLNRAYDNAIVLRETIGSEALSYIQLAVYAMNTAARSEAPLIELQQIADDLMAFWGIVDDQIESEHIRNIIKAGKRIERIDLYARMKVCREKLEREILRMIPRVLRSGLKYNEQHLMAVNAQLQQENLNYQEIIMHVEAIVG